MVKRPKDIQEELKDCFSEEVEQDKKNTRKTNAKETQTEIFLISFTIKSPNYLSSLYAPQHLLIS